ncbi:hypothetical protein GF337_18445 [candidate division KSB1 bacterium]|nr:hypothetical protein [candidate division KSB1 bacterium]
MKTKYKIEFALTHLVGFFAKTLPHRFALKTGDAIGSLFYHLIRVRREVALKNLRIAFGNEKNDSELMKIVKENYQHFGRVLMEFGRIPLLKRSTILEEIPIHNRQILDDAIGQDRGVVLLSGHFGNWEYLAAAAANVGRNCYAVFKPQKNKAVDTIIKDYRMHVGIHPLKIKEAAAKGIFRAIREKSIALIVIDQDAGKSGMFIDFFGKPASTNRGAASLIIRLRAPVVMGFGIRGENGRTEIHLEKFPDPSMFSNDDEGIKNLLTEYNKILEKYIRQYPEQYMWMHKRWRTKKLN